jgi:small-conductance mechanosensitive channel
MQYCSNACKCKAYQTRQTNEQSIKRLKKIPGFQYTRSKQKDVPAQTLNGHQSIIDEQRQTINKQKAYIEHLHKQAEQFAEAITYETNKQVKEAIEQAKIAIDMFNDIKEKYYAEIEKNKELEKKLISSRDQMIGNIGAAIISKMKI